MKTTQPKARSAPSKTTRRAVRGSRQVSSLTAPRPAGTPRPIFALPSGAQYRLDDKKTIGGTVFLRFTAVDPDRMPRKLIVPVDQAKKLLRLLA